MNVLSFDIEEWFIEQYYLGNRLNQYDYFNQYLNRLLEKLAEKNLKATFFCVGGMAREFPNVLRLIHEFGHDIGCHSDMHVWMNRITEAEAREDTHRAVDSIEQLLGQKVLSYRAPAFTIGESNKWMFDVLAENGIVMDASVYPATRDFGGFVSFAESSPSIIRHNGIELKEFPISITRVLGKDMAYSGGGFFRLLPLCFVKETMMKHDYNMAYFHIGDIVPWNLNVSDEIFEQYFKIPATKKNRLIRSFKSNIGKMHAFDKLMKLIDTTDFVNLHQADKQIDWEKVPIVNI